MNNPIRYIKDGFVNIIKGLGTAKDPRTQNIFVPPIRITQQQANDIYTYNWMAAKCIDIPVDDATRKWREILIEDEKKKQDIEEVFKEFDVKGKVNISMKWARAFGGSAMIFMFKDQDPSEPLDLDAIRKDSLSNIIVLDRYNLIANTVDRDILSTNFARPETYFIARSGTVVHRTRIVLFHGYIPTIYQFEQENFWGLSYFNRGFEPIQESQSVSDNISAAIYESNVDVYKINGLYAMVADQKDALVVKRLQLAHEMKGVVNGIVLDKDDEYDKKSNTFASLPEIDDRFIQKVSGCWNIPVTRLIGTSPSGMNSTGESDMLNYYDNVQSVQENDIRPKLDVIDKIIMSSSFGTTEPLEYIFNPLKQMTEIEQAEVDFKNSQRDQIYWNIGSATEIDIMAELANKGTYVSIDADRVIEEKKLEEINGQEE